MSFLKSKLDTVKGFFALLDKARNTPLVGEQFYHEAIRQGHVQQDLALFIAPYFQPFAGSPFYLMKDLARRGTHRIAYVTTDPERDGRIMNRYGIDAVALEPDTRAYYEMLATAGYIVDAIGTPPFFVPRKDQILLQTWHSTPLKAMGKRAPKAWMPMGWVAHLFLKSTVLWYQNRYAYELMQRDYCLENTWVGEAIISGSPRNEIFFDRKRREELRTELGWQGKRVIGYLPTWRGSTNDMGAQVGQEKFLSILTYLDKNMPDDMIIACKMHAMSGITVDWDTYQHIIPFSQDIELYDSLNACDVLLTDYSSVMFDYVNTKRPIIIFSYDYDQYSVDRATYFDISELPFPTCSDEIELVNILKSFDTLSLDEGAIATFRETFNPYDNADASAELNDAVLGVSQVQGKHTIAHGEVIEQNPCIDLYVLPNFSTDQGTLLHQLIEEEPHLDQVLYCIGLDDDPGLIQTFFDEHMIVDGEEVSYYFPLISNTEMPQDEFILSLGERLPFLSSFGDKVRTYQTRNHLPNLNVRKVVVYDQTMADTLGIQYLGAPIEYR